MKKNCFHFLTALLVSLFYVQGHAQVFPNEEWEYADGEQLKSWSDKKLEKAKKYWQEFGSTALMVVENGKIVAEWGNTTKNINCHSVRKSFLSALYGAYSNEIDIHKTLAEIGIDEKTPLTAEEKQATIRDLLLSKSGIYLRSAYETQAMGEKRPLRGSHAPGTFWYYNNWDFNTLGTIFTKITRQDIYKAFNKSIANKIGMQDFSIRNNKYVYVSASIHPAYTFTMSARDRARFGLLFLNNGKWKNEQVIPKEWVEESTTYHTKTSSNNNGYSYLWWTSVNDRQYRYQFEQPTYSARGVGGQIILVIPEKNMVIVQAVDTGKQEKTNPDKSFSTLLQLIMEAQI